MTPYTADCQFMGDAWDTWLRMLDRLRGSLERLSGSIGRLRGSLERPWEVTPSQNLSGNGTWVHVR